MKIQNHQNMTTKWLWKREVKKSKHKKAPSWSQDYTNNSAVNVFYHIAKFHGINYSSSSAAISYAIASKAEHILMLSKWACSAAE